MRRLLPEFDGRLELDAVPENLSDILADRVEHGLFIRGNRRRANYHVRHKTRDSIEFYAGDWLTAINIGLNDVTVRRENATCIVYTVTFRKWTAYGVGLCALIAGLLLMAFLIFPSMRSDIHEMRYGPIVFWTSLGFWGVAWPWILTALHKKNAARCLERILRDECLDTAADETRYGGGIVIDDS